MKKLLFHQHVIRLLSLAAGIYMFYYLGWRAAHTLNPAAPFFSWTLLAAEAFGVFNYILFAWMTWDVPAPSAAPPTGRRKKVDIFIPTYNESLEILEATLIGCQKIRYPHTTTVLDDGRRQSVKELAVRLGCDYLARPTNEHHKAGNINAALKHTDGEFIAILDCDMVPQPEFLDETLGYFDQDPMLALIQMPQEFYNADSFQQTRKGRRSWDEQSLFFRVIQPGKNRTNSAFWCGSPSVLRRAALEDVGGVATETITEDIHTTIRLHSRGWRTFFLNKPLAYGVAPQTLKAYLTQRLRWAQGTMQLYRSRENPLIIPGLTLAQRISYLTTFMAYFEAFQKFALVLTPAVILLFATLPMHVNGWDFLVHWLPYFALTTLANKASARGHFNYYGTELYNLLKMPIFMRSALTLVWRKPLRFIVTPKSVDKGVYAAERRSVSSHALMLGVLAGALLVGAWHLLSGTLAPGMSPLFYAVALFWAAFNGAFVFEGIRFVLAGRHERKHVRFPVGARAELINASEKTPVTELQLNDISLSGAGLVSKSPLDPDTRPLVLHVQTAPKEDLYLPLEQIYPRPAGKDGAQRVGITFQNLPDYERTRLFEYLFITLPVQAQIAAQAVEASHPLELPLRAPVRMRAGLAKRA